jgi:hypothetical protein
MRYRALDANGDYQIGVPFLVDAPAVAQAILTRLKLWQGEWFLDVTEGTPYLQSILAKSQNPDAYLKQRILSTPNVQSILSYRSNITARAFSVSATVQTIYGPVSVST